MLRMDRVAFADAAADARPYLGCSLRSNNDSPGMMVLLVNTESPAWLAGMKVGDILLEIEDIPINKIQDYHEAVDAKHGEKMKFVVNRKGQNY